MNNTKLFLLIGTSLSFIPQTINAQCVATQDCATLGYTETSCSGGSGVKCPFGNKWACFKSDSEVCQQYGFTQTCTGIGQLGKGESCANLYKQCGCNDTYKYTCSGIGYSGGSGTACGGKYTACTCTSSYEWKNGICQQQALNGAQGELYYCNGKIVGIRTTDMNFYIAMNDLGEMTWDNANSSCQNYSFCGNIKGTLPTKDQLVSIYNNRLAVYNLLTTRGGTQITPNTYWSSTSSYGSYYVINMGTGAVYGGYNDYSILSVRPVLTSW